MRTLILSLALATLALSLSCGPGAESEFCSDALAANEPCLSNSAAEDCEARYSECPGEVLIAESCPVQFMCPSE